MTLAHEPLPGGIGPLSYANITACTRSRRSSFVRMLETWVLIVPSLTKRFRATSTWTCLASEESFEGDT